MDTRGKINCFVITFPGFSIILFSSISSLESNQFSIMKHYLIKAKTKRKKKRNERTKRESDSTIEYNGQS